MPQLIKRKVLLIRDVIDNGHFLTLREMGNRHGPYPGLMLDYHLLINALRPLGQTIFRDNPETHTNENFFFNNMTVGKIGRKQFNKLIKTVQTPAVVQHWQTNLNIKIDKERWLIPFKSTKEVRIHTLQWKIMHNIYPTAIILSKMGHRQTDKCQTCEVKETLMHFFFECKDSRKIWKEVENIIVALTGRRIKIDNCIALLGSTQEPNIPKKVNTIVNMMILIGKLVISKFKYGPKRNHIEILESEMSMRQIKI